ncbi:hypothetical protein A6R68_00242, partial [Neotoma lepida]
SRPAEQCLSCPCWLVLKSLEKVEENLAEELLENLAKVFSLMDPKSPKQAAFVFRALTWSSRGSGKLGHPRLHQLLALMLWRVQNYYKSQYYFLHLTEGQGCTNMLSCAILSLFEKQEQLTGVFTTYPQKHPSIEDGPPFVQSLLNFIWFLLLAVDWGKLAVFIHFFGELPKQTSSNAGLLGNLLSSLMGSSEQEMGEES